MEKSKKIKNANGLPAENLSFESFVAYLKNMDNDENSLKREYLKQLTSQYHDLIKSTKLTEASKKPSVTRLFELTDQTLSLRFDQPDSSFDIYTMPASGELLYIREELPGRLKSNDERDLFIKCLTGYLLNEKQLLSTLCYKAIWNHFVNSPCLLLPEIILPFKSAITGQLNYFQLIDDFNFIIIESGLSTDTCKQIIEEIDAVVVSADEVHQLLKEKLSLLQFAFIGFLRIRVIDVTVPYIIKLIARQVVAASRNGKNFSYMADVREALKVIAGNGNLKFGLLPMFQLNGKFIFTEHFNNDELVSNFNGFSQKSLFDFLINVYRLKPRRIYLKEITDELSSQYEYLKIHRENGIQSFALLPVFYHDQLVGVLEIYTNKAQDMSKTTLGRLETFFPVLSTIFKKSIESLKQTVQEVIKTKFTSLQPSVQWRFNQAAWQYIQDSAQPGSTEIEDIEFNQVYPLYGAVDIKDSTINRNRALREDAIYQLQLLNDMLLKVKESTSFSLLDEKIADCKKWLDHVNDESRTSQDGELEYFLENDIYQFLKELTEGKPEISPITENYFNTINDVNGMASTKRRMLENSMNQAISAINELIDDINLQAQVDFPCFFEKFRTDGVEYDIYIGQSIAPEQPFKHIFIQNLRLLQLANMITIAKRIWDMQEQLAVAIEITQLIFVHPNFINIRFRRDERRFDVEGAYNIRYHIVKKRIDKVLIKNTTERLTAPGKIAIVYFNQKEADEYLVHIQYLQKKLLLAEEVEVLELEQLQGVTGLKALRIAIRY